MAGFQPKTLNERFQIFCWAFTLCWSIRQSAYLILHPGLLIWRIPLQFRLSFCSQALRIGLPWLLSSYNLELNFPFIHWFRFFLIPQPSAKDPASHFSRALAAHLLTFPTPLVHHLSLHILIAHARWVSWGSLNYHMFLDLDPAA